MAEIFTGYKPFLRGMIGKVTVFALFGLSSILIGVDGFPGSPLEHKCGTPCR
jgi:hypothetical protein